MVVVEADFQYKCNIFSESDLTQKESVSNIELSHMIQFVVKTLQ